MTARARRDLVLDALWAPGQPASMGVWAILDGARTELVYRALLSTSLIKSCLYAGDLGPELTMAAPYLVQLEKDDRFTRTIIDQGWGDSWGIYFTSDRGLKQLRTHLRKFLVVRDERRRRLIFRYYDPRVLREYLPTCTLAELDTVFGPIERFVTEGHGGDTLLDFRRGETGLQRAEVPLEGPDARPAAAAAEPQSRRS